MSDSYGFMHDSGLSRGLDKDAKKSGQHLTSQVSSAAGRISSYESSTAGRKASPLARPRQNNGQLQDWRPRDHPASPLTRNTSRRAPSASHCPTPTNTHNDFSTVSRQTPQERTVQPDARLRVGVNKDSVLRGSCSMPRSAQPRTPANSQRSTVDFLSRAKIDSHGFVQCANGDIPGTRDEAR